ncbi:MAG: amino acid racemase, partial [Candidatus Omnitrophica bacterium]|nr:amino acid racemase [Candidatus Omnitrophota bacterium]
NDRTDYLIRNKGANPAEAIIDVIHRLHAIGAKIIGIPCNTAHAPAIFNVIETEIGTSHPDMIIVHMVKEVGYFLKENHPDVRSAGILCTLGAYKTRVYAEFLGAQGINILHPEALDQQAIHDIIYNPDTGIKAAPTLLHPGTREQIERVTAGLKSAGAQALILGCSEIPLLIKDNRLAGIPVIDPTRILARALLKCRKNISKESQDSSQAPVTDGRCP